LQSHFMIKRCFKVSRADIAYLHFIIESYEGLANLSTIDNRIGIVLLSIPQYFAGEVDSLLQALRTEISMTEIPFPEGFSDPLQLEHCLGEHQS
jgi:hypothetical protein